MLNRIAPIHLLFVASILLCFFAFMGYRMRSSSPAEVSETVPAMDLAALSGDAGASSLRPSGPTGLSAGLQAIDDEGDDEEWIPSLGGESSPAASTPPAGIRPPASSSTTDAVGATSHSGSIAGLVPGMGLTPPGGTTAAETVDEPEMAEDLPPMLTPPGGGLRPESELAAAGMSLPPPPLSGGVSESSSAGTDSFNQSASVISSSGYGGEDGLEDEDEFAYEDEFASSMPNLAMRPDTGGGRTARIIPPSRQEPELRESRSSAPPPRSSWDEEFSDPVQPRDPTPASETTRIYVVRPGDTLSSIAARELGSASLADNIFLGNRGVISDPDQLMVGAKIRLPVRGTLSIGDDYSPSSTAGGIAPPPRKPTQGLGRVHMVARGDTLSSIALHYYGSSASWRFLFEANKGVMANPNQLSVGMELVIPPYEELPAD